MLSSDRLKKETNRHLPSGVNNTSPDRYRSLRRNIFILMLLLTIVPLTIMAAISLQAGLETKMLFIYVLSVLAVIMAARKLSGGLINFLREAEEKQASACLALEHSQKLSSIGKMAAGVAHEINNPLTVINEKACLLKDLVENKADCNSQREKFVELAGSIIKSVERCRNVSRRLLGFAGQPEVKIETVGLNGVLEDVLGFMESEAILRNITIRLNLSDKLPQIAFDRGRLQQVFINIIANAFAAVEDGGTVTISTRQEGSDMIAAAVQDTGCGMSPETIRHIFEPFFTTRKKSGTGLGLPISYDIIKKLGGDIRVQSKVGSGTTFTVFLRITAT